MSEVQFTVQFAVNKERAKESNMDLVRYEKNRYAAELGVGIAEKKGWEKTDLPFSDNNDVYRLSVYVFTREELIKFVESKGGHL